MRAKKIITMGGIAAAAVSLQAAVVLDHFIDPIGGHAAEIVNGSSVSSASDTAVGLGLGLLGDTREITMDIDSVRPLAGNPSFPNTGSTETASANRTPDNYALEAGTHADTSSSIVYDDGGALSLDLSPFTAIQFFAAANDQDTWYLLTLANAGGSHTESVFQTANFAGSFSIPLAPFSLALGGLGGLESLTVTVDPQLYGGDVTIHALIAVPEPNAAWAFAGLCGLGALVRRFRS